MTYSHHLIGVHSDYLEARAVRPAQAQARGYRTVGSGKPAAEPETFAAHYGFPRTTSGLLIALLRRDGPTVRLPDSARPTP